MEKQKQLESKVELVYDVFVRRQEDVFPFIWKRHKYIFENGVVKPNSSLEEIDNYIRGYDQGHTSEFHKILEDVKIKRNKIIYLFSEHPGHTQERVRTGDFEYTWRKYMIKPRIKNKWKNKK